MFGHSVRRVEDDRLLRGRANYIDDLPFADALHVAFVRSPHAHAIIAELDCRPALSAPGVHTAIQGTDLMEIPGPLPMLGVPRHDLEKAIKPTIRRATRYAMAVDRVRFVGEIVAAVVAGDRYQANDAAEQVRVTYDPLTPITDVEQALRPDAPLVHEDFGDNVHAKFTVAKGDYAQAAAGADVILRRRFRVQRQTASPMECRGTVAKFDEATGILTVWSNNQMPHLLKRVLAHCLRLPPERVRIVLPDVGGGFGVKGAAYPEEIVVAHLAMQTGRTIKWTEDRLEHFAAANHAREQVLEMELAGKSDGTVLGIKSRFWMDSGAFNPFDLSMTYNTAVHMTGPYHVPNLHVEGISIATNKTPASPYRGAGRPQGVFAMERMLDRFARHLDLDPAELRRRNLIPPEAMPYDTGVLYKDAAGMVYDSGNYPLCLEQALELAGYKQFRADQAQARAAGRHLGIGIACYVEGTGVGPLEHTSISVGDDGMITVIPGSPSQGQGHETVMAQVVCEVLGVNMDQVRVLHPDTDVIPSGWGTGHSRVAVVGANATRDAAVRIREQALAGAARLLEVDKRDLELRGGQVSVRGAPARSVTLGELSQQFQLQALGGFLPETVTYANAAHAAVVAVDPEIGAVDVLRYIVVHDCGRVINPLIVDGQVHGGVSNGIGAALYEDLTYDGNGQLATASLMDYLLPGIGEAPPIIVGHVESPSTRNPLGIKGAGEGGAIAPPAAIAAAVEDALSPWNVEVAATPITPDSIRKLLNG